MATLEAAARVEYRRRLTGQLEKPPPAQGVYKARLPFLAWMATSLGAYLGLILRISIISFYHGPGIQPVNYNILYPNIIGALILGYISEFQVSLASPHAPRLHRVWYIFVATGVTGSISSLSTWHAEVNKMFTLQFDTGPGQIGRSYNGGWILDWTGAMWVGISVPLTALYLGQHAARYYKKTTHWKNPYRVEKSSSASMNNFQTVLTEQKDLDVSIFKNWKQNIAELLLIGTYVGCSFLIFSVPDPEIALAAGFGAVGAFLRYLLCSLNHAPEAPCDGFNLVCDGKFPLGTFLCNIIGCGVFAVINALLKFYTGALETNASTVLLAIGSGFCGCLSTLSALVLELDRLRFKNALIYVVLTTLFCQLEFVLIVTLPSIQFAAAFERNPLTYGPKIEFCGTHQNMCGVLLDQIGCLPQDRLTQSCSGSMTLPEYVGYCSCGSFNPGDHISELIVDAQSRANISHGLVSVWPQTSDLNDLRDVKDTFDFCLSHKNVCSDVFERMGCPQKHRVSNACNRQGRAQWRGQCECGAFNIGNSRVLELIVDTLLSDNLHPSSLVPFEMCSQFETLCGHILNNQMCPLGSRVVKGCGTPGDLSTWAGQCWCYYDDRVQSNRVTSILIDSRVSQFRNSLVVRNVNTTNFDVCSSFNSMCTFWHNSIECPAIQRRVSGCDPTNPRPTYVGAYQGICQCGLLDASERVLEWIIDAILEEEYVKITYVPPVATPHYLAAKTRIRAIF